MSEIVNSKMTNSTIIDRSEVMEYVIDGLIDQLGPIPTTLFDVTVIVTVVVTPLPPGDEDV
jgi:hypothetical protein